MENKKRGAHGEKLALCYLERRGYTLIAQNARFGHNEIDLIMREGDIIVFVEVKARMSGTYALAREAVNARKQSRLIHAAHAYLQGCPPDTKARFDVIEVDLTYNMVNHIENAFWEST